MLQKYCSPDPKKEIVITIGDSIIRGISRSYAGVKAQSPLAIIGSRGYLEIALNKGSAKTHFSVQKGDTIAVKIGF